MVNIQKSSQRRMIINWDGANLFSGQLTSAHRDAQTAKRVLEEIIDEHAVAGVDALVQCVWCAFTSSIPNMTSITDPHMWWNYTKQPGLESLQEAGYDLNQLLLDRCHKHGMEYLLGLRMNDRHDFQAERLFNMQNSQWRLKDLPGAMDYKHDGVRQPILAFIEEALERYDVDGIELDWMRWCHMFEVGQGNKHAHLLTDFVGQARQLLDAAAQRRGRDRLILGVRVPQRLEECEFLGFDLKSWIDEGLIDWVVPSDFLYTDFNTKTEDFVELAKGTDCKIYPAIHPAICWPISSGTLLVDLANYRAAARNFYAYGADGLSPYNYHFHWGRRSGDHRRPPATMWPAAMGYLRELRDPKLIGQRDRHYIFHALWDRPSESGFLNDDRIVLDRRQLQSPTSQHFRVAEDLTDAKLRATLQFKAIGLNEYENLDILLNGTLVADEYITRIFAKDGQTKYLGRVLPAFWEFTIDIPRGLPKPSIIKGDNELTIGFRAGSAKGEGAMTVDELQLYVYVSH